MIKIVVLPSASNRGHIKIMDDDKIIATVIASRDLDGKYEVGTTMSSGASHKFTQKDSEAVNLGEAYPTQKPKVILYYYLEGRATRLDSDDREIELTTGEYHRFILEEKAKMKLLGSNHNLKFQRYQEV